MVLLSVMMNTTSADVENQLRGLSEALLGSSMEPNEFQAPTIPTPGNYQLDEERLYKLTEKQLWNLLSSIIKNMSSGSTEDLITSPSPNVTASTDALTGLDSTDSMIIFVLVFFLWYGGLIFVCLIGLGVYKKPSSYEVYKKFVDRKDIREELKQQKDEERKQRRLLRQHSTGSMMSSMSLPANYHNGQISNNNKLSRSYPTSKAMESMVHVEEEEYLLESGGTDNEFGSPYRDKINGMSNRAIFET